MHGTSVKLRTLQGDYYHYFFETAKGAESMNTKKQNTPQEPHRFKKRHGTTTFYVAVYSNPNAKETAQDKIARLIRSDTELSGFGGMAVEKAILQ